MRSCDTNILFYAFHAGCPEHQRARAFIDSVSDDPDFVLCELVLMELYVLLRNPRLVDRPLSAPKAAAYCQSLRNNPGWGLVDYPGGLMDPIWKIAGWPGLSYRRIFDARLALTLLYHGVTHFFTRNTAHFQSYGLQSVSNPIDAP